MDYYGNNDWRDYQSLKHWKYIKREKVNGKWKYYYEDSKDKLNVAKVSKTGGNSGPALISKEYKNPDRKYGDKGYRFVSKEEYDNTRNGYNLLIGDKSAKAVIKEQVKTTADAVKDKVKDKLGYDERENYEAAKYYGFREWGKNAKAKYEKTALYKATKAENAVKDTAEKISNAAKDTTEKISNAAKGAANDVKKSVKDKLGYDEKNDLAIAEILRDGAAEIKRDANADLSAVLKLEPVNTKSGREAYEHASKKAQAAEEAYRKLGEDYEKAKAAYMKTPIGKLENAKSKVSSWLKKKFKIE